MTLILTSLISVLLFLSNLGNGCYKNSDYSPMSYSNGQGIFYYYFDPTNMNVNYYYAMAYAMDEFNRRTGVRWFYRPNIAPYNAQYELITVYSEPPNSNTLSSWDYNNRKLRIYDNWGHVHYKTVHEAAHGVGFLHEHQRSDKPSNVYVCANGDNQKNPFPFSSGGIKNCYFRQRIIEHITNRCIVPVGDNYGVGSELTLGDCPDDHYIWYEDTTDTIRVDRDNCLAVNSNDYNSPHNGGKITIEPCDLSDHRFKFKVPHQQEMTSYNGQGIDLSNSRNVLQTWTLGVTNERFQVEYEYNYWQYDRWSITHYGNEIGGDIHASYGECSGRNKVDTCGDDDCKQVIGGIQLSNSDISRINWIYRTEISTQIMFQNSYNNLCLDVKTGYFGNGKLIQMFSCHGGSNQRFYYDEITREIKTYNGIIKYCLDVDGPDYTNNINGAKVQIWSCNGNNNQKWDIIGTQIKSANGKCLDIDNGSKLAQLWSCNSGWNQQYQWIKQIEPQNSNNMPGGYYSYLMPKDSGCPIGFEDSAFYFDDEDNNNDNTNSGSFWSKFVGGNSQGGVEIGDRDDITTRSGTLLYFCASMNSGSSSRTFADIPGQYCFMVRDGQSCPSGFAYSYFDSDDEDNDNESKAFGNVHVVYKNSHGNSITKYCCKDDGMKNRAVHVMTSISSNNPDAFSLFPLLSANGCQKVHFYKDTQHWVERDSEDDSNSNDWHGDWNIRPDTSGEHRYHFRMQVCHYEKYNKRITNRIFMSHNSLCLDVKTGYFGNGKLIQMFSCHGDKNQRFYYNEITREIKTYNGGYCLDVHGPDYTNNINGAKVQIWSCNGNNNQKWDIIGTQIKSANGKCLDIDSGSKLAQLWSCNSGWNQQYQWNNPYYE